MTQDEKQKLLEDLRERRAKIVDELKSIATENPLVKGDFEVRVEDQGESIEDVYEEATDLDRNQAMVTMLEKEVKEIDQTIEKVESGEYGTCVNCAAPIEHARLKAMPVAALCVACAQEKTS